MTTHITFSFGLLLREFWGELSGEDVRSVAEEDFHSSVKRLVEARENEEAVVDIVWVLSLVGTALRRVIGVAWCGAMEEEAWMRGEVVVGGRGKPRGREDEGIGPDDLMKVGALMGVETETGIPVLFSGLFHGKESIFVMALLPTSLKFSFPMTD